MSKIKNIIFPDGLKSRGKIGIVAPAGMVDKDKFDRGIDLLKRRFGLEIVIPEDLFSPASFLAGSDVHRAGIVNRMFADEEIKAVFCARGGFGAMRILPLIDFQSIRNHPKMVIGFSDITALLVNLYQRSGICTYHGPVITTLTESSDTSLSAMEKALFDGPSYQLHLDHLEIIHPGTAAAPIVGGNLATLCHLIGTPFAPVCKDHILFIEDIGEPLYKIDRMLSQMALAGCFQGMKGLAVGAFTNCGDIQPLYDLIHEKFGNDGIPVVAGVSVGHIPDNMTVPIGCHATLNADKGSLMVNP